MAIKSIIAPVRGDGKGESVLGLALAIGRIFNSHVDVVHVHAKPEDMIPYGVPLTAAFRETILGAAENLAHQEEDRLRKLFDAYCAARQIGTIPYNSESFPLDALSVSWEEEAGKQADVIRRAGRFCDIIVVPRPEGESDLGFNTLNAALFDVRKLTAIAPPEPVEQTGQHVAIAWNGSPEAAHAVDRALPLLTAAGEVTVLCAPDDNVQDAETAKFQRYLRLHGVESLSRPFKVSRHNIGAPLLETAAKHGADMIVMGAFGSMKRRELVLGGVTEYVLEHTEIPLVMAH
ncbi:MAG: universal stress protein [Rhodospirillales bacterium]|nr:MAG: universal stress protein [Rhodospirillales bacterium]